MCETEVASWRFQDAIFRLRRVEPIFQLSEELGAVAFRVHPYRWPVIGHSCDLRSMSRDDLNQLPVVSNGHLEGVLSRAQIISYLQTHAELHR